MSWIILLTIVSMPGLIWCTALLHTAKDWSVRLLIGALGIMPIYQIAALATEKGLWQPSAATQIRAITDMIVNGLFLFGVYLLERTADQRYRGQVQLRLVESAPALERAHQMAYPPRSQPAA